MITRAGTALSTERPFPGLRPFEFADRAFFFGRRTHVYALYGLLDLSRFIAVIGSSGSGKSSLVRAGLLPLLEDEKSRRFITLHPGDHPIAALAEALVTLAQDDASEQGQKRRSIRYRRIELALKRSSFGISASLEEIPALGDASLLIVVDQFEELFRYATSVGVLVHKRFSDTLLRDEAASFVQLLLEAARAQGRSISVLITMRSDFIGDCARFNGLPEVVSAAQFLVPSLTRDQREEVIREPIGKAGATVEPALVERLLIDVGPDLDQLPVLSHCLARLWSCAGDGEERRHLTLEHYERIGRLDGALSQHADEVLASLPGLEVGTEQVFRALSERDSEGRAMRRALLFGRLLDESGISRSDLVQILERFRADDCSFILPSKSAVPDLLDDTRIDVVHEALLRRWDRINADGSGWLTAEDTDGRLYRALVVLLEGESTSGKITLPLDQVESRWRWWKSRPRTPAWGERYGGHFSRVERLFADSRAALAAARAARTRAIRLLFIGLAVAVVVLSITTGLALQQRGQAEAARAQAEALKIDAYRQESALLGPRAFGAFSPNGEFLVTLSWVKIAQLWHAKKNFTELATLQGDANIITCAAFSPSGTRVVTGSNDKTARLWNVAGRQLAILPHDDWVTSVAFSPDGTRILTTSYDKSARLWDANTGAPITVLRGHDDVVTSAAFSPDGARIVTASYDKTARVWDARTGAPIAVLTGHTGGVWSAMFSPDGRRIVTASADETARVWDASTGEPIAVMRGHEGVVTSATFSPDSRRVLTASYDRTARVWNASTGALISVLRGHDDVVTSAAFSPDGTRIVTTSWDNTARLWDGRDYAPVATLRGHQTSVWWAAFSSDGLRVVTASNDGTARLWMARTGRLLHVFSLVRPGIAEIFSTRRIIIGARRWLASR